MNLKFTILNWNIGGAKLLEKKTRKERDHVREELNGHLRHMIAAHRPRPDVVTLQEIVQYQEPNHDLVDLIDSIEGYKYFPVPLIDSKIYSSKAKWNKVKAASDWDANTFFAQGNGILMRGDAPCFPVWDLSKLGQPAQTDRNFIEKVSLESGLYFGDRNTEPRAALVAHFILDPDVEPGAKLEDRKPQDIFVVNLHLTTLMMEREGIPEIDARAARIRLDQLDTIFTGIVSRYNSWRQQKYPERESTRTPLPSETFLRHPPIWIFAGDFNFTIESEEYALIKRFNFIDVVPLKGRGTKASGYGNPATLTLDYVFAGPKFIALDPLITESDIADNAVNHDVASSDHFPMFATISIRPVGS